MIEQNNRKKWNPTTNALGLGCRQCGCGHFCVIYTRRAPGGRLIRRRECRHCGRRITTIEQEK